MSFEPKGQSDLLWLSDSAVLDGSKAIRGGIPICWPWFGPANNAEQPQHGHARINTWQITQLEENEQSVSLELKPNFTDVEVVAGLDLTVRFIFTNQVKMELETVNNKNSAIELSQAIHTYFAIDDISKVTVPELANCSYIDKLDNSLEKTLTSPLKVTQAMDTVFLTDKSPLSINRDTQTTYIKGLGHDSIVVWNPWIEGASAMTDFDDTGYNNMLCIEMANTQNLILEQGDSHVLVQEFGYK